MIRDLDRAIQEAIHQRQPIYMGEFRAYATADVDLRSRWTRFVADEATKRKIGFVYWEFWSGFGVYDAKHGQWIEPLKAALLSRR